MASGHNKLWPPPRAKYRTSVTEMVTKCKYLDKNQATLQLGVIGAYNEWACLRSQRTCYWVEFGSDHWSAD